MSTHLNQVVSDTFRVWHTTEKKMAYFGIWELLQYYNDESDYCRLADTDLFHFSQDGEYLKLMQSIGYQDRNRKEIYVGDILQDSFGQRVQVVAFCDTFHVLSGFTVRSFGKSPSPGTFGEVFAVSWLISAEVVGNIYETPIAEVS